MGPITPKQDVSEVEQADISIAVNGEIKQKSNLDKLINNIPELIENISVAWELQEGDLIFTGTPEGVGAVVTGDLMECKVAGLKDLDIKMV